MRNTPLMYICLVQRGVVWQATVIKGFNINGRDIVAADR